jgi:hypothetical protein
MTSSSFQMGRDSRNGMILNFTSDIIKLPGHKILELLIQLTTSLQVSEVATFRNASREYKRALSDFQSSTIEYYNTVQSEWKTNAGTRPRTGANRQRALDIIPPSAMPIASHSRRDKRCAPTSVRSDRRHSSSSLAGTETKSSLPIRIIPSEGSESSDSISDGDEESPPFPSDDKEEVTTGRQAKRGEGEEEGKRTTVSTSSGLESRLRQVSITKRT